MGALRTLHTLLVLPAGALCTLLVLHAVLRALPVPPVTTPRFVVDPRPGKPTAAVDPSRRGTNGRPLDSKHGCLDPRFPGTTGGTASFAVRHSTESADDFRVVQL